MIQMHGGPLDGGACDSESPYRQFIVPVAEDKEGKPLKTKVAVYKLEEVGRKRWYQWSHFEKGKS